MNIVLIGMPSSGKSSLGRVISNRLKFELIDTDILITNITGRNPGQIVLEDGLDGFLKLQEDIILGIHEKNVVISTGGAVVLSEKGMNHLKEDGKVFFLDENLRTIEERINQGRRLARSSGKSIEDVYLERLPLYKKYADFVIDCRNKELYEKCDEVLQKINC